MNKSETVKFLTKNGHWIVIDPGMRDLLHAMGYGDRIFRFSHRHYMFISRRLKIQEKSDSLSKRMFAEVEKKLVGFSAKTVDRKNFLEYVRATDEVDHLLKFDYENIVFRQMRFRGYSGRQKAEAVMVRDLIRRFGADIYIGYGDFSKTSNLRGMMSSPVIRTRNVLEKHFRLGILDEYNTSKRHYRTKKECGHQYAYDAYGNFRQLYAVLTSTG